MKIGIVTFPGSNCDDDMMHVLGSVYGSEVVRIWHKEKDLSTFGMGDWIILPGGFSYGDYLRSGAVARFSPIMKPVIDFAQRGGLVFGICNGFQILCEAGLLPGILLRNANQKFICKNVHIRVESVNSRITSTYKQGQVLKYPIAHAEGRFYADSKTLEKLKANDQILFRYCSPHGELTQKGNVNGSLDSIAGICNMQKNVFGMMPHPERCAEDVLGNSDGRPLFDAMLQSLSVSAEVAVYSE